jgi:hypothetical protein
VTGIGSPWGKPERGVFRDRTQEEIEAIGYHGEWCWWYLVVPATTLFLTIVFHLWMPLRIQYLWITLATLYYGWRHDR